MWDLGFSYYVACPFILCCHDFVLSFCLLWFYIGVYNEDPPNSSWKHWVRNFVYASAWVITHVFEDCGLSHVRVCWLDEWPFEVWRFLKKGDVINFKIFIYWEFNIHLWLTYRNWSFIIGHLLLVTYHCDVIDLTHTWDKSVSFTQDNWRSLHSHMK